MTRRERKSLLAGATVLAVICSALFARAVLAQRTADFARAQVRAALLSSRKVPAPDAAERAMIDWSGAAGQMRYWLALQRFRIVAGQAKNASQYTFLPMLPLIFRLDETLAALRRAATEDDSSQRRSRLEDMLGLGYFYDAALHRGEDPEEPEFDGKAIVAFRQAVLLDGSDAAAKTNLELLLRMQHRRQLRHVGHPKPLPGQTRAQNEQQSASGLPGQNGSVGRRFFGGY
jgi:hypothetical protein